jgi:4-hydroxyphenylpyruvate dioxygenase-like putative hemolysin
VSKNETPKFFWKVLHLRSTPRGWGQGGEINQALYAHMNNKRKMKKKIRSTP